MRRTTILGTLAALAFAAPASAHFQEMVPSADIIDEQGGRTVRLDLAFTHPMEMGPVMEMAPPVRFGVVSNGKNRDLRPLLKPGKRDGKTVYSADVVLDRPGDQVFFVEPAPYWEPAENKWIIHYAKVVVDFASGGGWDKPAGLPVEIEPLVRPYGLWTGNLFRGIVRHNGKPVPFAEIEVEWRSDGSVKAPSDPFVTQVIKADSTGQFAYAMPRAGWWGFAALIDGDKPAKSPEGKPAKTELGGLIWVRAQDMK